MGTKSGYKKYLETPEILLEEIKRNIIQNKGRLIFFYKKSYRNP